MTLDKIVESGVVIYVELHTFEEEWSIEAIITEEIRKRESI